MNCLYIDAKLPQICSGLKGPHAGILGKGIGIDDDAAIQRFRLHFPKIDILRDVLHHLCDHLTGGAGCGFHIRQDQIVDLFSALQMMIDQYHRLGLLYQIRTLKKFRTVYIHDNQGGVILHIITGFFRADKDSLTILFGSCKLVDHCLDRIGIAVDHDVRSLSQGPCRLVDPYCRGK